MFNWSSACFPARPPSREHECQHLVFIAINTLEYSIKCIQSVRSKQRAKGRNSARRDGAILVLTMILCKFTRNYINNKELCVCNFLVFCTIRSLLEICINEMKAAVLMEQERLTEQVCIGQFPVSMPVRACLGIWQWFACLQSSFSHRVGPKQVGPIW